MHMHIDIITHIYAPMHITHNQNMYVSIGTHTYNPYVLVEVCTYILKHIHI